MINLRDLSIQVGPVDIAPMVLGVTTLESIKGGVKGSITIQDNINFYDTFVGALQHLIEIEFEYAGSFCKNKFISDGITNMVITKKGKKYDINFISVQSMDFKTSLINEVYSTTSHRIIEKIFTEACNENSVLAIDTPAITKGRYIVPNIVAGAAIKRLLDTAFDVNASQLCLYQRMWDRGITRLTSYYDMNKTIFKNADGEIFTISNSSVSSTEKSVLATVGTSTQFTIEEANKDGSGKIAAGYYGQTVSHVELDETKETTYKPAEITNNEVTKYILSKDLYDDGVVSIFKTAADPVTRAAINQRKRLYNTFMSVSNIVAIPNVGCGMSINIDPGENDVSASRERNKKYIIQNIQHTMTLNDGEWSYSQNMGLIRE